MRVELTMKKIERVGMIGLGAMGGPMVKHILAKGFTVCGYDTNRALIDKAVAAGAT